MNAMYFLLTSTYRWNAIRGLPLFPESKRIASARSLPRFASVTGQLVDDKNRGNDESTMLSK
jgi:hypothetical protein